MMLEIKGRANTALCYAQTLAVHLRPYCFHPLWFEAAEQTLNTGPALSPNSKIRGQCRTVKDI